MYIPEQVNHSQHKREWWMKLNETGSSATTGRESKVGWETVARSANYWKFLGRGMWEHIFKRKIRLLFTVWVLWREKVFQFTEISFYNYNIKEVANQHRLCLAVYSLSTAFYKKDNDSARVRMETLTVIKTFHGKLFQKLPPVFAKLRRIKLMPNFFL